MMRGPEKKPKPGRSAVPGRKYAEAEPDVTGSGIGKCYPGYRIFFMRRTGVMEFINAEYETRAPTPDEVDAFMRDLTKAAQSNPKVAAFLSAYPALKTKLPEPKAEGPMGEPEPGKNQPPG